MSITPLHPQGLPPLSPDPQPCGLNESKIIRRWLWRQFITGCKAMLLVGLGFGLGFLCAIVIMARQADEGIQQERAAQLEQERRYATILLEPNQGQDFIMGALGLLLGAPAGAVQLAQGLAPPEPRWILKGKQTPMSSVPGAHFVWLDTQTQKTEGPFKPLRQAQDLRPEAVK